MNLLYSVKPKSNKGRGNKRAAEPVTERKTQNGRSTQPRKSNAVGQRSRKGQSSRYDKSGPVELNSFSDERKSRESVCNEVIGGRKSADAVGSVPDITSGTRKYFSRHQAAKSDDKTKRTKDGSISNTGVSTNKCTKGKCNLT